MKAVIEEQGGRGEDSKIKGHAEFSQIRVEGGKSTLGWGNSLQKSWEIRVG